MPFVTRTKKSLLPLALAVALLASACGSSASSTAEAVPESSDSTAGAASELTTTDSAEPGSEDAESSGADEPSAAAAGGAGDTGDANAPLVQPTETDAPFNLTAGATSSTTDVTVSDSGRDDLADGAASVSTLWPTDWTRRTIDLGELLPGLRGEDPRDGIPPIDVPRFENVTQAGDWLSDNEPGALVRLDGEARFYPLAILTRHEIVNDRFGDVPVAVTYCPLCNTAIAYDRRVDGEVLRFGVSGLLRKSDLVMWDDQTTSLWQQISGEGIVGQYAGTSLQPISTAIVSFSQFAESFPDGLSLSRTTGVGGGYGRNPYTGYSSLATPFLFDEEPDPRLPALSRVVGVLEDYGTKAYPFEALSGAQVVNDTINDEPVVVFWVDGTTDALDDSSIADSQSIGSAVAYRPVVDDQTLTFTSASAETFTDDQTGSTWSVTGQAIDGPLAGSELATVTHKNEFWFAFAGFFPDAAVYGL